jgi:hypothetical protein
VWHCILLEEMGINSHDANRQVQITYLNSVVMPDGESSGSEGSEGSEGSSEGSDESAETGGD